MMALGMVEVVGLPPAIEAADAALKAANVKLISIAKADAGILTVEITGDVGAVTAAVDAGAEAAARIGTLRAKHVIPRVDESLVGKVIIEGTKLFQKKGQKANTNKMTDYETESFSNSQLDTVSEDTTISEAVDTESTVKLKELEEMNSLPEVVTQEDTFVEDAITKTTPEEIKPTQPKSTVMETMKEEHPIYRAAELKKKSNDFLRNLLEDQYQVQVSSFGENMKKQDLISLILKHQNKE